MAAEAGGDIRAGIGTRLRGAREKKGLTILQAAEKMHVDARILESLEAEDFAALGAPVYARGHLRHYAELVGESPTELQQLYADSTKAAPAQPDLTRIARVEPESDPGKLVGPAVIGLVAVALVGIVWWLFTLSGEKVQPTTVQSKLESTSADQSVESGASQGNPAAAGTDADSGTPVAMPAPAPESTPRGGKNGVGAGTKPGAAAASSSTIPSARTAAATQANAKATASASAAATQLSAKTTAANAKSVPPSATRTAAATTSPPASTKAAAPTVAPPTAAAPIPVANLAAPTPTPRSKDGELTLKFSSDSWAEVYDASGQRLFYDVGAASSAHTVKGPAPLRVILGNASGVAVEFNGRPALIPAVIQPDGSTRFVINAHGRTAPASAASDGD
jgi:cytoskeleton protein RodZ